MREGHLEETGLLRERHDRLVRPQSRIEGDRRIDDVLGRIELAESSRGQTAGLLRQLLVRHRTDGVLLHQKVHEVADRPFSDRAGAAFTPCNAPRVITQRGRGCRNR